MKSLIIVLSLLFSTHSLANRCEWPQWQAFKSAT